MRPDVDREPRAQAARRSSAGDCGHPHTVDLVGGSSAVLVGWRASTRDVDVRPEPDSDELLRLLSDLKESLDINIELASPLDFLPELDGWRDRGPYVGVMGVPSGSPPCRQLSFAFLRSTWLVSAGGSTT